MQKQVRISKRMDDLPQGLKYNAQVWSKFNGKWAYSGNGKFFKTRKEALAFKKGIEFNGK